MQTALVDQDKIFMDVALSLARLGAARGDVPVGAVAVVQGRIRAMAFNDIVQTNEPLRHAEHLALTKLFQNESRLRIPGVTLYTTLEPCAMCAGAILLARVDRVVMAACDPKRGCTGSVYQLLDDPHFNHSARVDAGVREREASTMLSDFFRTLRQQKKEKALRSPSDERV